MYKKKSFMYSNIFHTNIQIIFHLSPYPIVSELVVFLMKKAINYLLKTELRKIFQFFNPILPKLTVLSDVYTVNYIFNYDN